MSMSSSSSTPPVYPRRSVIGPNLRLVQSQSSSNSSSSSSPFHPDSFVPQFDVVYELIHNKDSYIGEEHVSIYSLPSIITTCVDRICDKVSETSGSVPGVSTCLSCIIYNGLITIKNNEHVATLSSLKSQLNKLNMSNTYLEILANFFRSFRATPHLPSSGTPKPEQKLRLPKHIQQMASALQREVGLDSLSLLLSLALVVGLSTQTVALTKGLIQELEESSNIFFNTVEIRAKMTTAFFDSAQRLHLMPPVDSPVDDFDY